MENPQNCDKIGGKMCHEGYWNLTDADQCFLQMAEGDVDFITGTAYAESGFYVLERRECSRDIRQEVLKELENHFRLNLTIP